MPKWKGKSYPRGTLRYVHNRQYREHDPCNNGLLPDRLAYANYLFSKDLKGHFGCVNAIEFSPNGGELIASGGDDRRVLIWNAEKACSDVGQPATMTAQHHSNIFCLAFNSTASKVLSGGNDQQVIVHDINTAMEFSNDSPMFYQRLTRITEIHCEFQDKLTSCCSGAIVDVFLHEEAIYGLSVNPANDDVFISACDDGQILMHDLRLSQSEDPVCLASYASPMHSVMYNPVDPRLILTANSKEGLGLWDVRKPRSCLLRYGGGLAQQSCMSVRVSRQGDKVIALRRRLPPVLYDIHSPLPVVQFDTDSYYNSCTMKSCCFAGDRDQYIVSGSDDFNMCMWRIPDKPSTAWVGEAHLVLKGHRSIVNQVRFNPSNHLFLSSGVEKVIKVWSPVPISPGRDEDGYAVDGSQNQPRLERPLYTPEEYINLVLRSGQVMSHDYTHESTEEDPRMLAFFDSLVQREINGWSSDESPVSSPERYHRFVPTDNSDSSDGSHSDVEDGFSPFTMAFANEMRNAIGDAAPVATDRNDGNVSSSPTSNHAANTGADEMVATTGTEAPDSATVPKRQSIASLIANKRKEYMTTVARTEQRSKQKRRKKKLGTVVITGGAMLPRVGRCSDSDSSDMEQNGACSSSSSSGSCSGRKLLMEVLDERRRTNRGVRKLNRLRSRVADSGSDSASSDRRPGKQVDDNMSTRDCGSPSEPRPSTSSCGVRSRSKPGCIATLSSVRVTSVATETLSIETSKPTATVSCHSTLTAANCLSHRQVGSVDTAKADVTENNSSSSNNIICNELPSNGSNGLTTSNNGATNGASTSHQGAPHTTWKEFKRFRNKVERTRRHYRQRTDQKRQQSSEEDS